MTMTNNHPYPAKLKRSEVWLLLAASITVLASRLPWVTAGLGTDPDSFRVFNVAMSLLELGTYSYSRPPGYPVHEYLVAALVHLGPTGTNMLSALFSVGAFVFFALIIRRSGVRPYLLGALGFAFTPVVYINSTATIDYVPAITFVLAATYFVLSRDFIVAGVCLGISMGLRITSGVMLVPLVLWIALDADRGTAICSSFRLVTTTLFIAAICFVPVLHKYGLSFFTFSDNIGYPSLQQLVMKGVFSVWGSAGGLALIGLCYFSPLYINRIRSRLAERQSLALVLLAATSVVMYIGAFLRLPHESGYLVPIIPFTIMLFGLVVPPSYMRLLALFLFFSSFITIGRSGVTLDGPILNDHHARVVMQERTRAIIAAVDQLPRTAIIVAGWKLPSIETQLRSAGRNLNQFVYLIHDENACTEYQNEGRKIFFLPGIDRHNKKVYGVDLIQCHAQQLDPLDEE